MTAESPGNACSAVVHRLGHDRPPLRSQSLPGVVDGGNRAPVVLMDHSQPLKDGHVPHGCALPGRGFRRRGRNAFADAGSRGSRTRTGGQRRPVGCGRRTPATRPATTGPSRSPRTATGTAPGEPPARGCTFTVEWYNFDKRQRHLQRDLREKAPTADVGLSGDRPGAGPAREDDGAGGGPRPGRHAGVHAVLHGDPHPVQGYHVKLDHQHARLDRRRRQAQGVLGEGCKTTNAHHPDHHPAHRRRPSGPPPRPRRRPARRLRRPRRRRLRLPRRRRLRLPRLRRPRRAPRAVRRRRLRRRRPHRRPHPSYRRSRPRRRLACRQRSTPARVAAVAQIRLRVATVRSVWPAVCCWPPVD